MELTARAEQLQQQGREARRGRALAKFAKSSEDTTPGTPSDAGKQSPAGSRSGGTTAAAPSAGPAPAGARRGGGRSKLGESPAPSSSSGVEGKVDNNIRVMPPEMVEALVSRDEDSVVDGYGNKPAGSAKTPGGGGGGGKKGGLDPFAGKKEEEEEDLLTRDDLKAVSMRLARKAARKQKGPGEGEGGGETKSALKKK